MHCNLANKEFCKVSKDLEFIATISGRFYAMDRDKKWDRIKTCYDLLTKGKGEKTENIEETIKNSYKKNITDEFIKPICLDKKSIVQNKDFVFLVLILLPHLMIIMLEIFYSI